MSQVVRKFEEPLKEDLENLLSRFQHLSSVRYEDFSCIWRDMKFSDIFIGIRHVKEKNEFTRMALRTATSYFLPPHPFQVRVGGLYCLYGLYLTQTAFPSQKIRLALKDWEEVQAFTQDALSSQHYDVVYVLHKLLALKAFHFTAMPLPLTFETEKKQADPNAKPPPPPETRLQKLVTTDMLEEMANIHQHYMKMKAFVRKQHPDASIDLIRHNLIPNLFDSVVSLNADLTEIKSGEEISEEPESSPKPSTSTSSSQQQECSQRANRLAAIKSRSYGQLVEVARSRRHRQAELCTDTEAGPCMDAEVGLEAEAKPKGYSTFNTLRNRTLRRLREQGSIPEEGLSSTKQWKLSRADLDKPDRIFNKRYNWW